MLISCFANQDADGTSFLLFFAMYQRGIDSKIMTSVPTSTPSSSITLNTYERSARQTASDSSKSKGVGTQIMYNGTPLGISMHPN